MTTNAAKIYMEPEKTLKNQSNHEENKVGGITLPDPVEGSHQAVLQSQIIRRSITAVDLFCLPWFGKRATEFTHSPQTAPTFTHILTT